MMDYFPKDTQNRIEYWLQGPFDPKTKSEIQELLLHDPKKLESAFFQDLSFGTGGMRGLMGVGTNRMNIYTVRAATQGLANYLLKLKGKEKLRVFIGYDVRKNSREFAEEAGRVLIANGIEALISKEVCPTPLVSFACRYFHCDGAIVITASHNPPEYNGYKVYGKDGAQIVFPQDEAIIKEVRLIKTAKLGDAASIRWIGKELDQAYLTELKKLRLHETTHGNHLHILYTNLHGTGIRIIPQALASWGYSNVALVPEQASLDGNFPNAPSPNPEEEKALSIGTNLLMEKRADLLLATDPDADRMGIVVRHEGKAVRMTGNQIACVCLHHICSSLEEKKELPLNAAFVKTIVTSEMFKKIAEGFGGTCFDVLTGFKYIAEKIRLWENESEGLQYLFGAEESYGYLFGSFVRDKDAISSCCVIAEAAYLSKKEGKTLVDKLHDLYRAYGIHREKLISLSFPDTREGQAQSTALVQRLRENPPTHIGKIKVDFIQDYMNGREPLPTSDALRFWLLDGSKLVVRPSGTEPKIKIYIEVFEPVFEPIEAAIAAADQRLNELSITFVKQTREN